MAENIGAALGQSPISFVRPQIGNFIADKSGADARFRVVPRDFAATDEPEELRARKRKSKPMRFNGDEKCCAFEK